MFLGFSFDAWMDARVHCIMIVVAFGLEVCFQGMPRPCDFSYFYACAWGNKGTRKRLGRGVRGQGII